MVTLIKLIGSEGSPDFRPALIGQDSWGYEVILPKPQDPSKAPYFNELAGRIFRGDSPMAAVTGYQQAAELYVPGLKDSALSKIPVTLDFPKDRPRGIFIPPWNRMGEAVYIEFAISGTELGYVPPSTVDWDAVKRTASAWDWVAHLDSKQVFHAYVEQVRDNEYTREEEKEILARVQRDAERTMIDTALGKQVDLVLMGLFTPDNFVPASGWQHASGIGDLCDMTELGIPFVNHLRKSGYNGAIVAVKAYPHTMLDTYFNRMGLLALRVQKVVIAPSNHVSTLCNMLGGGPCISDYTLNPLPVSEAK